jgi:hypothetical protein
VDPEAVYAKKRLLQPDHPVGGRSAQFMGSDSASVRTGARGYDMDSYAAPVSPSRALVQQPLGGRGLVESGVRGLDDVHPTVGARRAGRSTASQITF